jgi:hypothetical protein
MIKINLLPADLRRGNRLPPRVLAAAFGTALIISAAVGWFGLTYFGTLADAEQQLVDVTAQLNSRGTKVKYHDQLAANRKDYALRVATIQDIGHSRRVWSQFMDDLIDVVNNSGATERHLAWFDSINVKGDPKKSVSVTLPSNVQGEDKSLMANFHEDLEAAPFAKDLSKKTDPTFRLEEDDSRIPSAYLKFPMALQFKPSVKPKAKRK